MRHRKIHSRINRSRSWRRATLISMSKNLLIHQSIRTTKVKAKATKRVVERLISLGKKNDLPSRRRAFSVLQDHKLVQLLFLDIAPRFNNRNGGFCRIIPFGFRRGDSANLVILELTEKKEKKKKPTKKGQVQPKPEEEAPKPPVKPKFRPPSTKKPMRKFLGGIRKIFKKERDAL